MTNQVIPAEAVEAAAKAWMDRKLKPGNWTQEDSMRAALEAAAPHMLAAAWDAAIDAAYERRVIGDTSSDALKLENPYRPAE